MNAGLSASPFQLSGQESARKAKADLFSCFVAGRVGQSNKANAIMEFALHPPGCEWGAVCKAGLDEKWHILVFLQLFPSKPIKTRAHIQVPQSGWWRGEVVGAPPSPVLWDSFKVFRESLDEGKLLVCYSNLWNPSDVSNPNQTSTLLENWEHKQKAMSTAHHLLIWYFKITSGIRV